MILLLTDQETSEIYSSSPGLIPGTRSHQNGNHGNSSSLGHESGFLSSGSLTSLTPSLIAGSLYECPISAVDNGGGSFYEYHACVSWPLSLVRQNCLGNMSSDSMASLTSGISFLQVPGMVGRRHSLNKLSNAMSGSRVSLARRSAHHYGAKDCKTIADSKGSRFSLST